MDILNYVISNVSLPMAQTAVDNNQEALEIIGEQINWIISLGGAVVLSITANLVTNPVQDIIARFSKARATKRVSQIQKEIQSLEDYFSEPLTLIAYAIKSLLSILLYFGFAEVVSALDRPFFNLLYLGGFVIEILVPFCIGYLYLKAILIAQDVLSTFRKLDSWPKYKLQQEAVIQKINSKKSS